MKALLALTLAMLAAAAAGVSFASPPGTEVLVTRDSLSLPAGCSPRQVADVVVNFSRQ